MNCLDFIQGLHSFGTHNSSKCRKWYFGGPEGGGGMTPDPIEARTCSVGRGGFGAPETSLFLFFGFSVYKQLTKTGTEKKTPGEEQV